MNLGPRRRPAERNEISFDRVRAVLCFLSATVSEPPSSPAARCVNNIARTPALPEIYGRPYTCERSATGYRYGHGIQHSARITPILTSITIRWKLIAPGSWVSIDGRSLALAGRKVVFDLPPKFIERRLFANYFRLGSVSVCGARRWLVDYRLTFYRMNREFDIGIVLRTKTIVSRNGRSRIRSFPQEVN